MKLCWHYTVGHRAQDGRGSFFDILESGYVDVSRESDGRPIAWFSADQFWERSVVRSYAIQNKDTGKVVHFKGDLALQFSYGVRQYRIGVSPERLLNWTALRKQSGMSAKCVRQLTANGAALGANQWDWYGSFSPVPRSEWQAVESFTGKSWEAFIVVDAEIFDCAIKTLV